MTTTGQVIEVYAGDACQPLVTITDDDGAAIDLSTATEIEFLVSRDFASEAPNVVSKLKSSGGVVLVGGGTTGECSPVLTNANTADLDGWYEFRARVTFGGERSTVTDGRFAVLL